MKSMARAIACAVAAIGILIPQPAGAHATLADSSPRDGSVLESLPKRVTLKLNEPVEGPAFVVVSDKSGERVNSDTVRVDGPTVTSPITNRAAGPGPFTVSYRIVSADAHVVSGTVKFSVNSGGAPPSPSQASPSPSAAEQTSMAGDNVSAKARDSRSDTAAIVFVLLALVAMTGLSILILLRLAGRAGQD